MGSEAGLHPQENRLPASQLLVIGGNVFAASLAGWAKACWLPAHLRGWDPHPRAFQGGPLHCWAGTPIPEIPPSQLPGFHPLESPENTCPQQCREGRDGVPVSHPQGLVQGLTQSLCSGKPCGVQSWEMPGGTGSSPETPQTSATSRIFSNRTSHVLSARCCMWGFSVVQSCSQLVRLLAQHRT